MIDVVLLTVFGLVTGFAIASCSETVNHKVSGDTTSTVNMTQDVCTEKNGFSTPDMRRDCILCMRNVQLCKCIK